MDRKITETLMQWRSAPPGKKALVVTGERQIGKTYSIDEFGKSEYGSYLRLDFSNDVEARGLFDGNLDATGILDALRTRYRGFRIVEGDTLLFLDEIQLCPNARSAIKPLVNDGNIIDKFFFRVQQGKITEARAERGEDILKAAISVDEGASYFGEVALVPYDSPISNQHLLYYNTLFDENASCHIAFGEAYPNIEGGQAMTKEELKQHGLNDSITHVDFMVGTAALSITGTTRDGREVPIFRDGNFAL